MSEHQPSIERRLLRYDSGARRLLYAGIALKYAAALLVLALAWLLAEVVAKVFVGGQRPEDVMSLLAAMIALASARAALTFGGDLLALEAADRLKAHLRRDLTQHLLALGPAFRAGERSGELVHTAVQAVEDIDEYILAYQPLRWLAVLMPLSVALAVLLLDPFTVGILLLTGPVLVLLLVLIGSRARDATEQRFRDMSWTSAHLLDLLQGLATLKLFGRSREQVEAVRSISRRNGDLTMEVLRTAFETSFVLEICSALAVALVAVEVSLRLVEGALAFDVALALLVITPEFFLPLRQLSANYHAGATARAASEAVFTLLDTPVPARSPAPAHAGVSAGEIVFEHVSYSYGGREPALVNVSFRVPAGSTVAVIGETGAGKTTLVSLLLGFLTPESGEITVGGHRLASIDLAAWRRSVAWVPQTPHLFHGSVAENIRLARPEATDSEVVVAAMAAHAHDFILGLPLGYDTPIGENGARLSGGEAQRIAIARAFLKDAPVLVVDEATSHLDRETEAQVEASMRGLLKGRTVLLIAHRERMVRLADSAVELSHGRIVACGPPEDLLRASRASRELVAASEAASS